jgi:pSer/pThr/pTyr-binding forkhead associated (FHA) protein
MLDQLQWARSGVPVSVARMPFLIVRSGPRAGERIELVAELVVGRENADVTVSDEEVSRRHLAVRPHEDGVELEDLGSTNGTFVNGHKTVGATPLRNGDTVRIGSTTFRYEE